MLEAGVDIRHAPRRTNARVHHVLQSLKNLLMDEPGIINMRR